MGSSLSPGSDNPCHGWQNNVWHEQKYNVRKLWLAVNPRITSRHNVFGIDAEFSRCFEQSFLKRIVSSQNSSGCAAAFWASCKIKTITLAGHQPQTVHGAGFRLRHPCLTARMEKVYFFLSFSPKRHHFLNRPLFKAAHQ